MRSELRAACVSAMDPRTSFIVQNVFNLLGLSDAATESDRAALASDPALEGFLSDTGCRLLQVIVEADPGGDAKSFGAFKCGTEIKVPEPGTREVHFIKQRAEPLTEDNVAALLLVSSLKQSPLHSLFRAVHSVYAPALRDSSDGTVDRHLQGLLEELDRGLTNAVSRGEEKADDRGGGGSGSGGVDGLVGIFGPTDEVRYWEDAASRPGRQRDGAAVVHDAFERVAGRLGRLGDLTLSELLELIEDMQDVLEDIWKAELPGGGYPQTRMRHTFNVTGRALGRRVQDVLGRLDLWSGSFGELRVSLREGHRVCEKWGNVVEELTSRFWPTYAEHPWHGDPHVDSFMSTLGARLDELRR